MPKDIDLQGLKDADSKTKPPGFSDTVSELLALEDDGARDLVRARLRELGLGLAGNRYPIQSGAGLLRWIVSRHAVLYDRDPSRWLKSSSGSRIAENRGEHKNMLAVYEAAQIDDALRYADRVRALAGQAILRLYPVPEEKAVCVRVFSPNAVYRDPSPSAADRIDSDSRFALELAGETFEVWERGSAGWRMWWTDKNGEVLESSPFGASGVVPYAELPVHVLYETYPGGRAWIPARESRLGWAHSLTAIANDLLAGVAYGTHAVSKFLTHDEDAVPPTEVGPGRTVKLLRNERGDAEELEAMQVPTNVDKAVEVYLRLTEQWLHSEDIAVDELKGGSTATGAAFRSRDRSLIARREAQIPGARRAERMLWKKIRAVHNAHAEAWGAPLLADGTELEVEHAGVEVPTEQKDELDTLSREMALGVSSTIDAIQRVAKLGRAAAIARYERVIADREAYPPPSAPKPEAEPGAFSDALGDAVGQEIDSVTDAANGVGAAERRADRREAEA